jgi:hypothetical protein
VELKHIWRLMLITEKGCQDTCLEALKQLKALQILLGKDGDRIQRTLVVRAAGPDDESGHPESVIAALSERFPDLELLIGIDMPLAEGLYIVDPLGNVILRYASQDAGKPVLTDLKKLLKVSQIG